MLSALLNELRLSTFLTPNLSNKAKFEDDIYLLKHDLIVFFILIKIMLI